MKTHQVTTITQTEWDRSHRHGYTSTHEDGSTWQLANEDGATVLRPVAVVGVAADAITSRPWSGKSAVTGMTLDQYSEALANVADLPAWATRSAVSVHRSYGPQFFGVGDVAILASMIADALSHGNGWREWIAGHICRSYGIGGICDPGYIADVIRNQYRRQTLPACDREILEAGRRPINADPAEAGDRDPYHPQHNPVPDTFCDRCQVGPFFYVPERTHPTLCTDCGPTLEEQGA